MGFFNDTKCPYCGRTVEFFQKSAIKYNGEYLCSKCYGEIIKKTDIPFNKINEYSIEEIQALIEVTNSEIQKKKDWIESFEIKVGKVFCYRESTNEFAIPTDVSFIRGEIKEMDVYKCSDILSYELLEDGNTISKGGVGGAVVGGALLGGTGAIIGALTGKKQRNTCTKLEIKLTLKNLHTPTLYIVINNREIERGSALYEMFMSQAQEILSILDIIFSKISSDNEPKQASNSKASEIREFKQLLDEGIITQEEFEAKKKELLGL